MLGRHHLTLSVGSVAVAVAPLFPTLPRLVIVAIAGAAIGSLVPDADSPDAAIFHQEVRGIEGSNAEVLNALGILYPVFGYATKYLIYKPAVAFYDRFVFENLEIRERHRGFLHSLLGLATCTILTGVYMVVVLLLLHLFSVRYLLGFLIAYFVGAVLHLTQDSCTKTGIQWNYPFQGWSINGQISTTARAEDMRYQRGLLTGLGGLTVAMFVLPLIVQQIPAVLFSIGGGLLVVLIWVGFGRFAADCTVYPG